MSNMKNVPGKIYLQIGDECDSEDFNELSEVSWCKDRIYDNDIEFAIQNKVSDEEKQARIDLLEPINTIKDLLYEYGKYFSNFYKSGNPYPGFSGNTDIECVDEFLEHIKDEPFFKQENKVSDVSAEEKEIELRASFEKILPMGMPSLLEKCVKTSQEYASIVNEKDNIPADFKQVTGHNSPKEMIAYEKGREDEQEVIMKWIEQWDGSSNSAMGTLLKKKFEERKDSAGVNLIKWIRENWIVGTNNLWRRQKDMRDQRTDQNLYEEYLFSEEEESEKELEDRTDRNMNVISAFVGHVKNEVGLVIPESAILSFFNA